MAALTGRRDNSKRRPAVWRWVILIAAGVYFLLPLYAATRFAGFHAFGTVFVQPGF
jgi:hypothetical protein